MSGSVICFTVLSFLVKGLIGRVPQMELVFIRSFLNLIFITALILHSREKFYQGHAGVLTVRACAGFVGIVALFFGITHLPLAIASLLSWASPLFVLIFSALFLKERYSPRALFFVGGAFTGLYFLLNPDFTHSELKYSAVIFSLVGAASSALAYMTIRRATRKVSTHAIVFYFMVVSTLLSLPLSWSELVWPSQDTWPWLIGIGIASTLAQLSMTTAYSYARASFVSMMNLLNPLLASIVGYLFFSEQLSGYQMGGMALVLVSIGFLAWGEMK